MNAYSKANSIAEKYSENYSKTDSDSTSFATKVMPAVTKQFIENDERLKAMYENGDIRAKKDAINDATYRINDAYNSGRGADFNNLNNAFITITGFDAKGNVSDLVNQNIQNGENLNKEVTNSVKNGEGSAHNANINNTINQNPNETYKTQSDDFKNKSNADMNTHKEKVSLNTQNHIDKVGEVIEERRKENADDSRSGKAFVAAGSGGLGDVKKGVENFIKNGNKDTAYMTKDGKPLPSNELSDIKNQLSYLKEDIADSQYEQIPQSKTEKKGGKK
jgi:conjugal transfer mating pair stabilization protein TraG